MPIRFFHKKHMDETNVTTQAEPTEPTPEGEAVPVEPTPEVTETEAEPTIEEAPKEPETPSEPIIEETETKEEETPQVENPELNCVDCNGLGLNEDQTARCSKCGGTGKV